MRLGKRKKIQKIKNMINQTSNIVYHYTDMNALINILNKERIVLRASNCLYLNDAKEILEGIESIKRIENNTDITKGAFRNYYITSFSKLYDSLTMWGMYAANGFGCSIGFDLDVLRNNYHGYTHCIYGEKDIDQHLNSFLKLCRKGSYVSFPTNGKSSIIKKTEEMISDMVINQYITTCLSAKNENFKFENEIRCFYANHDCKKEVYFKTKNGVIIPYIEVEIPKEALKEIIIGPTNKQDLAIQSVLHFLSINGYDWKKISVKMSKVPYRG